MYIKLFEKWGIDKNLEDAVDEYLSVIKSKPIKNKFRFVLYNDTGNQFFDVEITSLEVNREGYLSYNTDEETGISSDYKIFLTNRNDKSTFLHELKHLDRILRLGSKSKGNILNKGLDWVKHLGDHSNKGIYSMFYLLEDDEFEAKYHGYYSNIDKYLKENLIKNPSREDVINQINFYLKLPEVDKSYSWWRTDRYFKFNDYEKNTKVNKIFDLLINGEITPFIIPSTDIRELFTSVKTFLKLKFGIKSKLEKEQINKLVEQTERLLNKNKEKYRKKFNRLYTIMIDKYVNKLIIV